MKKVLLFSALLCAISFKIFAQTSSDGGKFSIGVDAGLPVGSAHNSYSSALGGDLKYSLPVSSNVSVSFSAGYTVLTGKDFTYSYYNGVSSVSISGRVKNADAIPLKIGARYTANGSTGFFGEAQVGAAFINQGGGTAFAYAPAIGYAFDGGFEAGVRYEGWAKSGTFGQVALRLAYSF